MSLTERLTDVLTHRKKNWSTFTRLFGTLSEPVESNATLHTLIAHLSFWKHPLIYQSVLFLYNLAKIYSFSTRTSYLRRPLSWITLFPDVRWDQLLCVIKQFATINLTTDKFVRKESLLWNAATAGRLRVQNIKKVVWKTVISKE